MPKKYNGSLPVEGIKKGYFFRSSGYGDELTWAAIWMHKATDSKKYLEQAEGFYSTFRLKERPNEFFYNKKVAGLQVNILGKYLGV